MKLRRGSSPRWLAWLLCLALLSNLLALPLASARQAAGSAAGAYLGEICSVHTDAASPDDPSVPAQGTHLGHCAACALHHPGQASAPLAVVLRLPAPLRPPRPESPAARRVEAPRSWALMRAPPALT